MTVASIRFRILGLVLFQAGQWLGSKWKQAGAVDIAGERGGRQISHDPPSYSSSVALAVVNGRTETMQPQLGRPIVFLKWCLTAAEGGVQVADGRH